MDCAPVPRPCVWVKSKKPCVSSEVAAYPERLASRSVDLGEARRRGEPVEVQQLRDCEQSTQTHEVNANKCRPRKSGRQRNNASRQCQCLPLDFSRTCTGALERTGC
eukprot:4993125-Pleurochrysis_carterae.AAC.7